MFSVAKHSYSKEIFLKHAYFYPPLQYGVVTKQITLL